MKIRVTSEHIRRGEQHSLSACPIALAVREHDGFADAEVGSFFVYKGRSFLFPPSFTTPSKAAKFIQDFDAGRAVEPFEFELEPL